MFRSLAISAVAVVGAFPFALSAQSPAAAPTRPETCRVLEAAYTTAIDSTRLAAPIDVRPSTRQLELRRFDPEYIRRMALEPGEFEDLQSRGDVADIIGFLPRCGWDGVPTPVPHHGMWVRFTDPVFSTDGRLALVEASFHGEGWWGYGKLCIVRRSGTGWSARCLSSWVT